MRRRDVMTGGVAMAAAAATGATEARAQEPAADVFAQVRRMAAERARRPFEPVDVALPAALRDLSYDQYRDIRFRPDKALWRAEGLPFQVQFFHRAGRAPNRVDIFEVVEGAIRPIRYDPALYSFDGPKPPAAPGDIGFNGFRVHAPVNRPDYFDEVCVFQGAAYFRALGKGQIYGLSARGFSIDTGEQTPEEFPDFRAFWLERPAAGAASVTVHALSDSPSGVGAHRFVITPGEAAVFEVDFELHPRKAIAGLGVAPMSSMFLFGPDRSGAPADVEDDYRPGVHDSDGLAMANGVGEHLWRVLDNPASTQGSRFDDPGVRGFGLVQRERRFAAYEDLEALYHRRPSLWVEPRGDWGPGGVYLLEIATRQETDDNIAAFWRPAAPLPALVPRAFAYRLSWGARLGEAAGLCRVVQTRSGAGGGKGWADASDAASRGLRRYVVDFDFPVGLPTDLKAAVQVSAGEARNIVLHPNPEAGGLRLAFELAPGSAKVVDLRASLQAGGRIVSEVWLDRWTAPRQG